MQNETQRSAYPNLNEASEIKFMLTKIIKKNKSLASPNEKVMGKLIKKAGKKEVKTVEKEKIQTRKRILSGAVVSDKMDKTVVVKISWLKLDKKYKRRYRQSQKYQAHDPENKFKNGDNVSIIESPPISKNKKWRVVY